MSIFGATVLLAEVVVFGGVAFLGSLFVCIVDFPLSFPIPFFGRFLSFLGNLYVRLLNGHECIER